MRNVLIKMYNQPRKTMFGSSRPETLVEVLSCEFCEISHNNFFYRIPLVGTSECALINKHME